MSRLQIALLGVSLALGLGFLYVDTRPTWDDTGVLAVGIAGSCFALGSAEPRRPWLHALCVGAWIPLFGIAAHGNFGSLLALVFALAGAYTGMAGRRWFEYTTGPETER